MFGTKLKIHLNIKFIKDTSKFISDNSNINYFIICEQVINQNQVGKKFKY